MTSRSNSERVREKDFLSPLRKINFILELFNQQTSKMVVTEIILNIMFQIWYIKTFLPIHFIYILFLNYLKYLGSLRNSQGECSGPRLVSGYMY